MGGWLLGIWVGMLDNIVNGLEFVKCLCVGWMDGLSNGLVGWLVWFCVPAYGVSNLPLCFYFISSGWRLVVRMDGWIHFIVFV